MSKRHSAKYKLDRVMGENLWGRSKSPVNKRSYGPGQHGQRRKSKVSDFGLQLKAKQKLKGYYGNITEKQFSATYEEASRRKGNSSENLIGLLESRLDAIVYRAKFVPTVWAARQFVSHGHITVDGKKVDIGSYRVKPGQVIEVKEKSRAMALVLEAQQSSERDIPDYLEIGDRACACRNSGTGGICRRIQVRTAQPLALGREGAAPFHRQERDAGPARRDAAAGPGMAGAAAAGSRRGGRALAAGPWARHRPRGGACCRVRDAAQARGEGARVVLDERADP